MKSTINNLTELKSYNELKERQKSFHSKGASLRSAQDKFKSVNIEIRDAERDLSKAYSTSDITNAQMKEQRQKVEALKDEKLSLRREIETLTEERAGFEQELEALEKNLLKEAEPHISKLSKMFAEKLESARDINAQLINIQGQTRDIHLKKVPGLADRGPGGPSTAVKRIKKQISKWNNWVDLVTK